MAGFGSNWEVERYYIYRGGEYFDSIGYQDYEEALEIAKENNCDEIEVHTWETRESYNNYEPADNQGVVWTADEDA